MNPEFDKHKKLFLSAFDTTVRAAEGEIYTDYTLFIKGDISGIQDFIFSVKSDGASKSLKGRSHFIEAATAIVVKKLEDDFKGNFHLLYDGGGNFYGLMKNVTLEEVSTIQAQLDADLLGQDFYFSLTAIAVTTPDFINFGAKWKALHVKAAEDKLKRFQNADFTQLFTPYPKRKEPLKAEEFSSQLVRSKSRRIEKATHTAHLDNRIRLFGYHYDVEAANNADKNLTFDNKITNELPKNKDGSITDFGKLAQRAHGRTGTEKLAVLKFDVDNLGTTFQKITDIKKTVVLSKALKWLFESYLFDLWQKKGIYTEGVYSENLYVVFSGGDDGFVVGAWDAVFEFAQLLNTEFDKFVRRPLQNDELNMTLSAALLLIDPHFPVVRFAHLAEDELKKAKKNKPNIAIFGEMLTWEDFDKAREVALKLKDFVENKGESRTILDRIKRSRSGFEKLQNRAFTEGVLRAQALWRLQYYLRSSKNKKALEDLIILPYQKALLLGALNNGLTKMNPAVFPVAARWAEFLTRKKDKN